MEPPLGLEHLSGHSDHGVGRLGDGSHRSMDGQEDPRGYADSGQPMFAPSVPQELQLPPGLGAHMTSVRVCRYRS